MYNIKHLEAEALYFINQFPKSKIAVSFSGGKDSLVALHLAWRAGIKRAVLSDTTIEPIETIEYAKDIANYFNIELKILRPKKTFWELLPLFGPPSINNRWCCPTIKYPQLNEYAKRYGIKFFITGLRRKESTIRKNYEKLGKNKMLPYTTEVNPIINWSEKDVWEYIKSYELPTLDTYNEGFSRNGCIFCPYKSDDEINKLKIKERDLWEKFEAFLISYADKMGIMDKEYFIKKGWKTWRPPIKRKFVGYISYRRGNELYLSSDVKKVLQNSSLIKLIPSNHECNIKKYKILIEKVLNCIGCGACLSLCQHDALYINEKGQIDLRVEKCKHCYSCLETGKLRGGCVARNYSLEVFKVDILQDEITVLCPAK